MKGTVLSLLLLLLAGVASASDVVIPQYNVLTGEVTPLIRHAPYDEPGSGLTMTVRVVLSYEFAADCSYYNFWAPHFSFADTAEKCRASAEYETMHGMEGWVHRAYRQVLHVAEIGVEPAPAVAVQR